MCVLRCLVRLADLGNVFPQYLHPYRSDLFVTWVLLLFELDEDEDGLKICLSVFCTVEDVGLGLGLEDEEMEAGGRYR